MASSRLLTQQILVVKSFLKAAEGNFQPCVARKSDKAWINWNYETSTQYPFLSPNRHQPLWLRCQVHHPVGL